MRSDKAKNKAKIIKEVLKDPMASEREIAQRVGISPSTAHEHIKDIPNSSKSEQIEKIIAKDLEIVELATEILAKRLRLADEGENKMSTRDVIASADVSAKRYSLFKGKATDEEGGLKEQTSVVVEIVRKDLGDNI